MSSQHLSNPQFIRHSYQTKIRQPLSLPWSTSGRHSSTTYFPFLHIPYLTLYSSIFQPSITHLAEFTSFQLQSQGKMASISTTTTPPPRFATTSIPTPKPTTTTSQPQSQPQPQPQTTLSNYYANKDLSWWLNLARTFKEARNVPLPDDKEGGDRDLQISRYWLRQDRKVKLKWDICMYGCGISFGWRVGENETREKERRKTRIEKST